MALHTYTHRLCALYNITIHIHNIVYTYYIIGIFDGHAGGRCSKYISRKIPDTLFSNEHFNSNLSNAIRQTFYNINQEFLTLAERHTLNDGSTALCIIIRNHIITIANVGDCRAILISENCSKVMQLSIDQKPSLPKEKARIG